MSASLKRQQKLYFTYEVAKALKVAIGAVEDCYALGGEEGYVAVRTAFADLLKIAAAELEYARSGK